MKRLFTILTLVLILIMSCLIITGCGDDKKQGETADTYEIALITDVGHVDDKSFNQGTWEGVESYAKANNITYNYYRPTDDSKTARIEAIKSAINAGAKVVVLPGYLFEEPLYEVQGTYPDVQFLLIDGEPHDANYNYSTASNVHCILFQEEQAGYLAGYAAVMDGYRKLGFLGGMNVDEVIRYGYGFVQGANDAAKELKVEKEVSIKYWYSGSYLATDEITTKMQTWYADGTEVVFSCGKGIYLSAIKAAEDANKKVIGVDVDQSSESDVIITSAMKKLKDSVEIALTNLYATPEKKWSAELAGQTVRLGVANNCVGLPEEEGAWRLKNYNVEDYNKLFENVKNGTITISDNITTTPKVDITVDYQK